MAASSCEGFAPTVRRCRPSRSLRSRRSSMRVVHSRPDSIYTSRNRSGSRDSCRRCASSCLSEPRPKLRRSAYRTDCSRSWRVAAAMEREGGQEVERSTGIEFARGSGPQRRLAIPEPSTIDNEELVQIIHDLKNPLGAIALEAQLLDVRITAGNAVETARAIARILDNVHYLDRLVNDLMDANAVMNGQLALKRSNCDLALLLSDVVERAVPRI